MDEAGYISFLKCMWDELREDAAAGSKTTWMMGNYNEMKTKLKDQGYSLEKIKQYEREHPLPRE